MISFYEGMSMDGNSPYHHQESRGRDAKAESPMGFSNGEERRGLSLPSPLYNRNPSPFNSPPSLSSIPISPINDYTKVKEVARKDEIECLSLEEILASCCEYEKQIQMERSTKPVVQNRIKTNGSLPREKRLNSPNSPPHHKPFNYDSLERVENGEGLRKIHHNYENVGMVTGSPRPRIKTFVNKDNHMKDHHESRENKIPLILDFQNDPKANLENFMREELRYQNVLVPQSSSTPSHQPPPKQRSPPDQIKRSSSSDSDSGRPPSIAEANANNKYNFLGYDPRRDGSPSPTSPGRELSLKDSPPSWANPKLAFDSFPDYEMVGEGEDESWKEEKFILPLALPLPSSPNSSRGDELKKEREEILSKLSALKSKISDVEVQEEEFIRETEIEEALVRGEIEAELKSIEREERKLSLLHERIKECEEAMAKCLNHQEESQQHFRLVYEKHNNEIDRLEKQLALCTVQDSKAEIKEALQEQHDLLDTEKKAQEVLEFQLLEEEAGWLTKRDDLQKELNDAVKRLEAKKGNLDTLKRQPAQASNNLEVQRVMYRRAIEEWRSRLKDINGKLEEMNKKDKSDMDRESLFGEGKVIRRRVTSQDDLDRISKVTSGAPMDIGSCNSLGRKTLASLQEIERNRQLHLANHGSLVIEEERQRVDELKRRAQDEVRAQWEQQRNSNCQSITSDDLNLKSTDPARDSGVGIEEEKNSPVTECSVKFENEKRDSEVEPSETPERAESRPISNLSSSSDDRSTPIKLRSKSTNNLQRPLTRYLPITGEGLNLRSHIETAGHQIELCPHLTVDSTSCRGFLQKMGSIFHHWNKRWFVFDRQKRALTYYSDKNEKKQRGGAYFQAIEEVYVDHMNSVKSPNPATTFIVKSATRTYYLVAPSPEAMRIWVDVIITGAEGYQLYNHH